MTTKTYKYNRYRCIISYPDFDFSETESEAADLCEILDENSDLSVDKPLIDLAVAQT